MIWILTGFLLFVLALLALDLGIFHRKAHVVRVKEALVWSGIWIALALLFSVFVYFGYEHHWLGLGTRPDAVDRSAQFPQGRINDGASAAVKYLTGYVVEKSLSADNIFVMVMVFGFFAVPAVYQHRVLFWGILGALVMRGVMIGVGAQLIARFHWILYLFGAFLLLTAIKMLFTDSQGKDPSRNIVVRLARAVFPVTDHFHGSHFFVRAGSSGSHEPAVKGEPQTPDNAVELVRPGTLMLTPLALALVVIETTDLVFAVDSIPAIFAITADPFLVFTSNVFAILGLRSLYFALAGAMEQLKYLKVSLAIILAVVGAKMLAAEWLKDLLGDAFNFYLLGIVLLILAVGIVASLVHRRRNGGIEESRAATVRERAAREVESTAR